MQALLIAQLSGTMRPEFYLLWLTLVVIRHRLWRDCASCAAAKLLDLRDFCTASN